MRIIIVKYFKQYLISLCFLFCFSFFSFSQIQKDSILEKERKVHFKVFYSSVYCLKKTKNKNTELSLSQTPSEDFQYLSYASKDEKGKYGYEIGGMIEILLLKHLLFNTGLSYGKMSYETKQGSTIYVKQTYQIQPFSIDTVNNIQVKHSLTVFSIPIIFNYKIIKKKFDYTFGGGCSLNLIAKNSTTETPGRQYGAEQTIYEGKSQPSFSLILNAGINYHITKLFLIGIEPNFKCYFVSPTLFFMNNFDRLNLLTLGTNIFLKF